MGSGVVVLVTGWLSVRMMVEAVAPVESAGLQLRRFQQSSAEFVSMQKEGMRLRKERKAGERLNYAEHAAVTQSGMDAGKVFNILFITLYARWWAPITIYFFPDMLPSVFESEQLRLRRYGRLAEHRRKAVMEAVSQDAALSGAANRALRAPSKAKALDKVLESVEDFVDDQALKGLPNPIFYATSRAFDGPYRILPKGFHVRAIRAGVKKIAEADETLRRSELNTLSPKLLELACIDRAVSTSQGRGAMIHGLNEWLQLTGKVDQHCRDPLSPRANQARLALLALNTVSLCRKQDQAYVALYGHRNF